MTNQDDPGAVWTHATPHAYTCPICDFTTTAAAAMETHLIDGHRFPAPALRDGRLATDADLLADHLTALVADYLAGKRPPEAPAE